MTDYPPRITAEHYMTLERLQDKIIEMNKAGEEYRIAVRNSLHEDLQIFQSEYQMSSEEMQKKVSLGEMAQTPKVAEWLHTLETKAVVDEIFREHAERHDFQPIDFQPFIDKCKT